MLKVFLLSFLTLSAFAQNCDEIRQSLLDQKAQIELYEQEQAEFKSNVNALQEAVDEATTKNNKNWLWISGGVLAAATTVYTGYSSYKAIKAGTFKSKVSIIKALLGVGTGVGSFFLIRKAYLNSSELIQLNFELEQIDIELDEKKKRIQLVKAKYDEYKENLDIACQN